MTNLNSENADVEFERYIDAYNLSQASLPIDNVLNKQKRFNPVSGRNDVVFRMGNGGYIKIGEEDLPPPLQPVVDETLAQPPQMMTEGMQQPEVATELPVSDIEIQGAQQFNEEQRRIGNIPTLEDFDAAGYSKEVVEAAGFGQPEIIKPLTQEEIQQRLETGGIEIATTDPTIRESAANAMSRYLTDIALQNLREELQAQGANERTIQETLRTRENELFGEAEVITNAIWGHKSGVGVADFATAGILDIQEGYRLYEQSLYTGNNTDRVFGLLLMAAGVGGLGGVAKAVKSKLPAIRERLNQPGPMPTTSMFGAGEIDRGLAAAGKLTTPKIEDGLPGRISTRLPTAKAATEDPMTGELIVGLEEMKTDPALYEFNVNITKDYPNMQTIEGESVDETAERFIEHVKDNLLYLHDKVPADTRVRSQKWYDGARAITDNWSKEYGVPDTSIAGVLAALSPQKDWYQNVSLGQRVLDVAVKNKDFKMSNEMTDLFFSLKDQKGKPVFDKPKYRPLLDSIKGKSYSEIVDDDPKVQATLRALFVRLYDQTYNKPDYRIVGPEGDFLDIATNADGSPSKAAWGSLNEIGKAVASIDAMGDVNTISLLMGERHKVRNFYNNIYDPNSPFGDVTIDTHAVAAGLLRPLSGNSLEVDHNFKNMSVKGRGTTKGSSKTGVSGNYGLYAEAYRRAAAERGILPRQMQSITWEAVRGLFTDKFKQSAKNVADVDAIWQRYKNGEIDLDETRRLVDERAGGINPPSWE